MSKLTTKPSHGSRIAEEKGNITQIFQAFFDDLEVKLNDRLLGNQIVLESYTVLTLPAVPDITSPGLIYVSDETGGAVPAFSDGAAWRRITDRAIVS